MLYTIQMQSEVMKDVDRETGQEVDLAADQEVDLAADQEADLAADQELPGILIEDVLKSRVGKGNIKHVTWRAAREVAKKPLL